MSDIAAKLAEALKLLLSYTRSCEALLNCSPAGQIAIADAALAAYEAAQAMSPKSVSGTSEPVAWADPDDFEQDRDWVVVKVAHQFAGAPEGFIPLYAATPPAPAPEAMPTWDNGEAPLVGGGLIRPGLVDYQERAAQAQAKPRKPLTEEEIDGLDWHLSAERDYEPYTGQECLVVAGKREFARAIERAHGIGASTKESGNACNVD